MSDEREKQSPAAAAAEQVRAIVEAAERETESQLRRVQQAADGLAGRADEIERELERLAEGVRDAIRQLREDLKQLPGGAKRPAEAAAEGGAEEAAAEAAPEPVGRGAAVAHEEPGAAPRSVAGPGPDAPPDPVTGGAAVAHAEPPEDIKPAAERDQATEVRPEPGDGEAQEPTGAGAGNEGARVIALNMALSGSTRDETAAYLAENFELDDPNALLDDVYARAGG